MFVSRLIGDTLRPGELLTFDVTNQCTLKPFTSVFLSPAPVALSLDSTFSLSNNEIYWQTDGDATSGEPARIYQWDAQRSRATNLSLPLNRGSRWCVFVVHVRLFCESSILVACFARRQGRHGRRSAKQQSLLLCVGRRSSASVKRLHNVRGGVFAFLLEIVLSLLSACLCFCFKIESEISRIDAGAC